jgi:hypothetical protein
MNRDLAVRIDREISRRTRFQSSSRLRSERARDELEKLRLIRGRIERGDPLSARDGDLLALTLRRSP